MAVRPKYKKTVFSNGLTLVTERHPEFRSLSIGIWVKAGTRHERPAEVGVSHFLEHMLFKGTTTRSALEIARSIDRVGGEFNAFTAREYTCFHVLLLDRDVDLGLEILSDVVLNSDFDPDELERERKVILQEIAMIDETPEELAHDLFFEKIFPRHGLGRPILGTESSIRRMKRGDLTRYFRKHYRPEQIVVSVAGNVSHEYVKKRIRPLLRKQWPGRPEKRATRRDLGFEPAPKLKHGAWWATRPTEQVHLLWGVEGVSFSSRDRWAALVLNVHLGGGMSSTLFQEIREKNGLAYTVYSSLSPYLDTGVFSIYAATSMNQVPLCVKLIEDSVKKLTRELLTEEELRMTQENLKGSVLLSDDSAESRMISLARDNIFLGEHHDPEEICRRIDEVTAQDIRRIARKLMRHGNKSLFFLGPKPSKAVKTKLLK